MGKKGEKLKRRVKQGKIGKNGDIRRKIEKYVEIGEILKSGEIWEY